MCPISVPRLGLRLLLWVVTLLRLPGVTGSEEAMIDCPAPGGSLVDEPESPYRLVLSNEATDVGLGYIPGVVYQVSVSGPGQNSSMVRSYILRATGENDSQAAAQLSLPSPAYRRCGRGGRKGAAVSVVQGIVGPAMGDLLSNWSAPQLSGLGCVDFRAYILETDGTWFSATNKFCERKGCFRYVMTSHGVLSSGEGDRYENNINCTTFLHAAPNEVLHLQFEKFDLEPFRDAADSCFDYVSVGRTENEAASPAKQICGVFSHRQLTNLSFVSDGSFIVVKFVSDSKISRGGFSAIFYSLPTSGCDNYFNSSSGYFESPGFPGDYFPNLDCTYTIEAPVNHRITLTFTEFDLQKKEEFEQCSDYVIVQESPSDGQNNVFCGNQRRTVTSSLNWLRLVFHSDYRLQGAGFRASYTVYRSCENETYTTDNGTITSLGYPGPYLHNQLCYVTIVTDQIHKVIELQFDLLQTQASTTSYLKDAECDADYVEIHDGATIQRRCGDWRSKLDRLAFRSVGQRLVVKFVTDGQGTGLGYVARWLVVENDTEDVQYADGWYAHGHSLFRVEKAPRTWYAAADDCKSQGAQLASVRSAEVEAFLQTLVKNSLNSSDDSVVWIGANDQQYEADFYWPDGSRVLYTDWFPGWSQYNDYNRQPSDDGLGNQDCVELRASFTFPSKGAGQTPDLYWNDRDCRVANSYICERLKPGGLVPRPQSSSPGCVTSLEVDEGHTSGLYTSPGFPSNYDDSTVCSATLRAPRGHVIQLEFLYFHLEESESCEYDSLTMSSMADNNTISSIVRCGDWNNRLKLIRYVSLSNVLHLKFVSDHSHHFVGFKARYSLADASTLCPGPQWRHHSGRCYFLQTLALNWMRAHQTCRMYGAGLVMDDETNQRDVLNDLIRNSGEATFWMGIKWSNRTSNRTWLDRNNTDADMTTALTSSDVGDGRPITCPALYFTRKTVHEVLVECATSHPFICQWDVLGTHPVLELSVNNNVTTLTSPGFPARPYPTHVRARWRVGAAPGELLLFTVSPLDLEHHAECLYDYLLISDPLSGAAARFCGHHRGLSYSVSGHLATVELVSDYLTTGAGFNLSWVTFLRNQTGNHTVDVHGNGTSGALESLNYPLSHLNNLSYWVTVTVDEGWRVWLEMVDVELGRGGVPCADRLSVYTDAGESHVMCGELSPEQLVNAEFLSRGTNARIHFTTDSAANGRGYKMNYRAVPREDFHLSVTRALGPNATGEVLSLNSPYGYPPGLDYTLTLQAPLGSLLQLTLTHLELLTNSSECRLDDHLAVRDPHAAGGGAALLGRLCGRHSEQLTFTSYLHFMQLRFVTADRQVALPSGYGYAMTYAVIADPLFVNKSLTDRTVPVGPCELSPCQNGGRCEETADGATSCRCVGPYTGLVCSWRHCDRDPCQNAGSCVNRDAGYNCTCRPGYAGATCDLDLDQCRDTRCNKHGVCIVKHNWDIECICEYNYMGRTCELLKGPRVKTATRLVEEPFWIGIIVVIGVLTLTGFVILLRRKCLKHVEVNCCCCRQKSSEPEDMFKGDKMSLSNDTGSNYMCGYNDYLAETYQRTPQLSADPSQASTPARKQSDVPVIRIYNEDDSDIGFLFNTNSDYHSLDAAAAMIVPQTADIINATSTLNCCRGENLSAIDEEPSVSGHYISQEMLAVATSEDEDSVSLTSEAGQVAFIHRDADGRELETSGETTIKRSSQGRRTHSFRSTTRASEHELHRPFSNTSFDDKRSKDTGFHSWSSIEVDKHQMVKEGKLYDPEEESSGMGQGEGAKPKPIPESHNRDDDTSENIPYQHRRVNSAQRREQFVSAVRQARNQNSDRSVPSSAGQCHDSSSYCSCCTVTSHNSDPSRMRTRSPDDNFHGVFSQSLDVSDSEWHQGRWKRNSRCSMDSDDLEAPCNHHHHHNHHTRRSAHNPHSRVRHSRKHRSSCSSDDDQHRRYSRQSTHERQSHRWSKLRPDSWSVSVDIPDRDIEAMPSLSRSPSYVSTKSDQTCSRRRRHDTKSSTESRRSHSHTRERRHRSSSNEHRHHRSTHSLNEAHFHNESSHSLSENRHKARSAHSLNEHVDRKHHRSHSRRHRSRDSVDRPPREHRRLSFTSSDPAQSSSKVKVSEASKRSHASRSVSDGISESRSKSSSNNRKNHFEVERQHGGSRKEHRGRRRVHQHTVPNVDVTHPPKPAPGETTSQESDSPSVDYLQVPGFESVFVSDLDSVGGTSPEASSTSGVSSTDQRLPSPDSTDTYNHEQISLQTIDLRRATPSDSRRSLDIDTAVEENPSVLDLFKIHSGIPNLYPVESYVFNFERDLSNREDFDYMDGVADAKHPLQDSAYQSKDQSTEKIISKSESDVVSPTLQSSLSTAELHYYVNNSFKPTRNDDQCVTNQLELAARKLAAIKNAENPSPPEESDEATKPSTTDSTELKIGCMDKEGVKFLRRRKIWPSRILSIIMDEGESDLSDQGTCTDLQHGRIAAQDWNSREHSPNFLESPSPRKGNRYPARNLTIPGRPRSPLHSSSDTEDGRLCVGQMPLSQVEEKSRSVSPAERRGGFSVQTPVARNVEIMRDLIRENSKPEGSGSTVGAVTLADSSEPIVVYIDMEDDENQLLDDERVQAEPLCYYNEASAESPIRIISQLPSPETHADNYRFTRGDGNTNQGMPIVERSPHSGAVEISESLSDMNLEQPTTYAEEAIMFGQPRMPRYMEPKDGDIFIDTNGDSQEGEQMIVSLAQLQLHTQTELELQERAKDKVGYFSLLGDIKIDLISEV